MGKAPIFRSVSTDSRNRFFGADSGTIAGEKFTLATRGDQRVGWLLTGLISATATSIDLTTLRRKNDNSTLLLLSSSVHLWHASVCASGGRAQSAIDIFNQTPDNLGSLTDPGSTPGQTIDLSRVLQQVQMSRNTKSASLGNQLKPATPTATPTHRVSAHSAVPGMPVIDATQALKLSQASASRAPQNRPLVIQGIDGRISILDTGESPEGMLPAGQANPAIGGSSAESAASVIYKHKGRVFLGNAATVQKLTQPLQTRPASPSPADQ